MSVAVITGSAGLVGSEAVQYFASLGMDIAGIDNGMRAKFFGEEASTAWMTERLTDEVRTYRHHQVDIRDTGGIGKIFARYGEEISLVIHAAAQPSHDWAANDPVTDFTVNANGTSVLLEATRQHAPEAVFIYMSTNKVYGDRPNSLPLIEKSTRWEIDPSHAYSAGIPETMSIDATLHSLFGASKVAADVLVQEYGRYFGMKTTCFRGGCLTGPNHSGTQLHGFLAYLMKCAVTNEPYRIFGYKGKQVRDNITPLTWCVRFTQSTTIRIAARCTTSAVGGTATVQCWRRSRSARRSPGRRCNAHTSMGTAAETISGGSAISANSVSTIQVGTYAMVCSKSSAKSSMQMSSAGGKHAPSRQEEHPRHSD